MVFRVLGQLEEVLLEEEASSSPHNSVVRQVGVSSVEAREGEKGGMLDDERHPLHLDSVDTHLHIALLVCKQGVQHAVKVWKVFYTIFQRRIRCFRAKNSERRPNGHVGKAC